MDVSSVCECIGASRFVWIDDDFNDTPDRLAAMLIENEEVTRACAFPRVGELLDGIGEDPVAVRADLVQLLADLSRSDLAAMKRGFFEERRRRCEQSATEFGGDVIDAICRTLKIEDDDRRPFDEGLRLVVELCTAGDAHVGYIVDLNDAVAGDRRGLDVLRELANSKSKGTAFILTHEVKVADEAAMEERLAHELGGDDTARVKVDVPVCVVAKERLFGVTQPSAVEEALAVALKRAGLRRCMHEVLRLARSHIVEEADNAASALLLVPPETLDAFVVERAFMEGLSELHVVERALTAHLSKSLRHLFGTDAGVRGQADAMRRLRDIALPTSEDRPDRRLAAFREAEIWETPELVNVGFAPVACGDVFESDEPASANGPKLRRFLLLGQPCDVSLRSDGKRDQDTAFLVPMVARSPREADARGAKLKESSFPFSVDDRVWTCNLRGATMARLSVLDLASFRDDGRVRFDAGQVAPAGLLPGQAAVYAARTAAAMRAASAKPQAADERKTGGPEIDPDLQLTLSRDADFKRICFGALVPGKKGSPAAVTWRLRRAGRVRMPYAAAMLETLTNVMSRRAYDLDFAHVGGGACATGKTAPLGTEAEASDRGGATVAAGDPDAI